MLVVLQLARCIMAKRIVMIGIDGCHQQTLYGLIDRGEVPFFNWMMENGTRVERAVTMFPATTGCCWSSIYTGDFYKKHGVLNNEWIDRFSVPVRGRSYLNGLHEALHSLDRRLFGFPSLLLPDRNEGGQMNNDLQSKTVFEWIGGAGKTSYSFFHFFAKGATRWVRPGKRDMVRYAYVEKFEKPYQIYEKMLKTRVIETIRKHGPADFLSIYFGSNDSHGHRHGVEGQAEYLRDFIDGELCEIRAEIERVCPDDEIYWAVVSDHGQTSIGETERNRCMWYTDVIPLIEDAGYSAPGRGLSSNELDGLDSILTQGNGACVGIYLRNRSTGSWKDQPDFEKDVVPVLNNFLRASATEGRFGDWKYPGFVDFLLTRKRFDEPYRVYRNSPPFEGVGELVELEDFFSGDAEKYVEPVIRIRGTDNPKNADIHLVLNYFDMHYNINAEDNFHPGQHGALCPEDSIVPMMFAGPGVKKEGIASAFTTNFAPTLAGILGVEMDCDGGPLDIMEGAGK